MHHFHGNLYIRNVQNLVTQPHGFIERMLILSYQNASIIMTIQQHHLYTKQSSSLNIHHFNPGLILGIGSANERRHYIVMPPLIGWVHTQNDPCNQHPDYDLIASINGKLQKWCNITYWSDVSFALTHWIQRQLHVAVWLKKRHKFWHLQDHCCCVIAKYLYSVRDIQEQWFTIDMIRQKRQHSVNGLVQDCGNSSALAMELPQYCTEPS